MGENDVEHLLPVGQLERVVSKQLLEQRVVLVERAVDGDHGVRLVQPVDDRGEQGRDQRCTAHGDDPA